MFGLIFFLASAVANAQTVKQNLQGGLRNKWEKVLKLKKSPKGVASMLDGKGAWDARVIWTIGESINGYTPPGILDGMGAYELNKFTVRVLVNHEIPNFRGYPYDTQNVKGLTGSRVSFFDIDKLTMTVKNAGLAYDRIYGVDGTLVQPGENFLFDLAGFSRFCSGRLVEPLAFGKGKQRRGIEDLIYFANEEDGGIFNNIGGAVWALDVVNKDFWQVPDFGRGAWENVSPVDTGSTETVAFVISDDTFSVDFDQDGTPEAAPLYLYVGTKNPKGNFLERNGLSGGKLHVLKSLTGERLPSQFNGAGNTLQAKWVEINNSRDISRASKSRETTDQIGLNPDGYPTQGNLTLQARDVGAFGFSRPEDVHENPKDPTTVVLASTGYDSYDGGSDTFGTLYTIKTNFKDLSATFGILYDGNEDTKRRIRSPDNLVWANNGRVCVQEDEAEEQSPTGEVLFGEGATNPNEAGIICINPQVPASSPKATRRIANIDREVVLDASIQDPTDAVDSDAGQAGEWESSGIIDVTDLFFGKTRGPLFLANVQAHGIEDQKETNPESRINDEDLVEGGQLLFVGKFLRKGFGKFGPF